MRHVRLTRRVMFSSGHRYWLGSRSADENRAIFGTWASPYNHGHNYALEVTTVGEINPTDGMVVNIKVIDDVLQASVVKPFDQKSINDEVAGFADRAPSLENLLMYFSTLLTEVLPAEAKLDSLRLEETPLLYGEWCAKDNLVTLTRTYEFAASHRLHSAQLTPERNIELFGKCNNPNGHGHNYILEVTVSGEIDSTTGMMVDLGALDSAVHQYVVDRYDHKNLSLDLPEFAGKNPTSEVVALQIFDALLPVVPAKLERVRLWETARNMFEVRADDRG